MSKLGLRIAIGPSYLLSFSGNRVLSEVYILFDLLHPVPFFPHLITLILLHPARSHILFLGFSTLIKLNTH